MKRMVYRQRYDQKSSRNCPVPFADITPKCQFVINTAFYAYFAITF
jgi:hypothetical protein